MMDQPEHLSDISGWILPNGQWHSTEEWWHINALYDLRDEGLAELQGAEASAVLSRGDEGEIRDFVARLGFVKISRNQIDAVQMTRNQLSTLQNLLLLCNPEQEIGILLGSTGMLKQVEVSRVMKLKNPALLFDNS